jgi:gluconolactonase
MKRLEKGDRRVNVKMHYVYVMCAAVFIVAACCSVSAQTPRKSDVLRLDPALDQLISSHAKLEDVKVDYFGRLEGPVWMPGKGMSGYLLFPEVAGNIVYKWQPNCSKYPCRPTAGTLSKYLTDASFTGKDLSDLGAVTYNGRLWVVHGGPLGLGLDAEHRLLISAFGDRQVVRIEKDGTRTVLAARWDGKRITCPDDLVAKSDGTVYFTDGPTSCLRLGAKDPSREIPYAALYMVKDGVVTQLDKDNQGVNGIALSPDEKILYVTGVNRKLLKYDVQPDDTVTNRRLFIDLLASAGITQIKRGTADAIFPDGVRVDEKGDVWTPGPGGIWVISPEGKHLGTILAPDDPELLSGQVFCSLAFGDDGKTLYITGNRDLRRIRLKVCGSGVPPFSCNAK